MKFFSSVFGMSDEQAMWRVQANDDPEAFAQLLNRWERPIQRLCGRFLADSHKAEDLTQETFARVYAKRREFQQGARFSTFLWRVATNLCLDELRRIKRRRELAVLPVADGEEAAWETLPGDAPAPDESALFQERAELVRRAVGQLPEHYQAVIILRHYENLKFREIAEVLDLPEGTIKSRMSEALAILHKRLTRAFSERRPGPARDPIEFKEAFVL